MKTIIFAACVTAGLTLFGIAHANAQQQDENHRVQIYGGPDAGQLLGKSVITPDQLSWSNAWVKYLGGQPPKDLPPGYIGLLVFASYPGHLVSIHPRTDTTTTTIRCRQLPLPDSHSKSAPASWAAGLFKAETIKLEGCP
ncbi:hypothetical protein [Modicisalibacter xianhensis]|uniref:hypothetical protein n=1 Tax=Modicisalibacter xianhensis TaxID=442341 RepID=UPI001160A083|nr:hypothetical protein [Halomonas xianhensis]